MLRARETSTRHEEVQASNVDTAAVGRESAALLTNRTTKKSLFYYKRILPGIRLRQGRKSKFYWAILLPTLLCIFLVTCLIVVLHYGTTIILLQDPNVNPSLTTTSADTATHQSTTDKFGGKTTTTTSMGCTMTSSASGAKAVMASTVSSNHDADLIDHSKCDERDNSTTSAFAVAVTTAPSTTSSDSFHLVFSTGCSPYQDWQSYIFFYHVYKIGQPGNVTRIASGCTERKVDRLKKKHDKQISRAMSSRFQIHFTPDYANIKGPTVQSSYKFFNKPFGMKHWMEHALGYSHSDIQKSNPNDNVIVILLDPDQLVLRPFTNDYSNVRMEWMRRGLAASSPKKVVQHGTTMAQNYAFGAEFAALNLTHVLLHEDEDEDEDRPGTKKSPLWNLSRETLRRYAAGPPYLATAKDMYRIVAKWSELVVRVHDVYPSLLAEMYAYCLATIQVGLRPLTAAGFMVSRVDLKKMGEAWYWIDDQIVPPTSTEVMSNAYLLDAYRSVCSRGQQQNQEQPFVLHYCQRYGEEINGTYYLSKYEMNSKFLSCDADLLREVTPNDLIRNDTDFQLVSNRLRYNIRDAWMMCTLIPLLNEAAVFFKRNHCNNNSSSSSSSSPANYDKKEWFAKIPQRKAW